MPRPFRLLTLLNIEAIDREVVVDQRSHSPESCASMADSQYQDIFKRMRNERKWFRNVSIHFTDFAAIDQDLQNQGLSNFATSKKRIPANSSGEDLSGQSHGRCHPRSITQSDHGFDISQARPASPPHKRTHATMQKLSASHSRDQTIQSICESLIVKISTILWVPREKIDKSKSMAEYGLDSLAAVELRSWLRRAFEVDLTILELLSVGDVKELSDKILIKSEPHTNGFHFRMRKRGRHLLNEGTRTP